MSQKNQISITIPQEVIEEVTSKLQEIRSALTPYLQGLTVEENRSLFKMGDKSIATVQKIENYIRSNPEFVPSYMDKDEFLKDGKVVSQLKPLLKLTDQLNSDLTDTITLAGSEAMVAGLMYYGTVKEAAGKGVITAKPIYEDLKQRFSKRKTKGSSEN